MIFIGSSVQGVLGFGFAVIASPIVVQVEPLLVPQLLSLLGLPLAIRIFIREKSKVDFVSVKPLIWGRLLGGPLGLYLLFLLSEKHLSISVGGIVFFAGIMVPIAVYAKSFKEAQSIITPLNILVFLPAMVGFFPGIELNLTTACIPVVNVVLATKDLIAGTLDIGLFSISFLVMFLIAFASVLFSYKQYSKESNIFS